MWSLVIALALLAAVDHTGAFGSHGDDWAAFDRQQVVVSAMYDFRTFVVRTGDGRQETIVLLGVAPAEGQWADEAAALAARRALGKVVTLRLEPTQTRDANHRLLAYMYLSNEESLNLDLISQGLANADSSQHTLRPQFNQAEADARRKHLGMWQSPASATPKPARRARTRRKAVVSIPSTRPVKK